MKPRPQVSVVVLPGTLTYTYAAIQEVFGVDYSRRFGSWYDLRLCGLEPGPVALDSGLTAHATHGLEGLYSADLVIVPGWRARPEECPPTPLLRAVRHAYANGARIMSVCSGAFVLGFAGLLNGRRSTTHWAHADQLQLLFPRTKVDPRALFVDDGRVFTSAGMSAAVDLALHVVRQDFGAQAASDLSRWLVLSGYRPGGQAQFVDSPLMTLPDDPVKTLLEWMRENLDKPLSVPDLAERLHVSPRTLTRRFGAATGMTPHQWLIRERLLQVQCLLETTDESVDRIARRCGFPSAATMRHLFRRQLGTTPQAYRTCFRARQSGEAEAC